MNSTCARRAARATLGATGPWTRATIKISEIGLFLTGTAPSVSHQVEIEVVKLAGVPTVGCAATQWKARFPRHYPTATRAALANRAFSSFCEGLNPGRLTHPAKRKQLRHQNLAQPTMCGVVASRLMPDRINRQWR
jgi:hypothetical protein